MEAERVKRFGQIFPGAACAEAGFIPIDPAHMQTWRPRCARGTEREQARVSASGCTGSSSGALHPRLMSPRLTCSGMTSALQREWQSYLCLGSLEGAVGKAGMVLQGSVAT